MKSFKEYLKLVIFFIFLSFLVWARIIRELLPRDLSKSNYNLLLALITIIIIVIFFTITFITVTRLLEITLSTHHHLKIFPRILALWREYFVNAPDSLLAILSKKYDFNAIFTNPFSYVVQYFYYPKFIVVSLIFFPTVLMAFVFFYEVLFNHYINYFYKLLPILFIPLCTKAIIYVMDQISTAQLDYVTPHMTCETLNNNLVLGLAPVSPNIPQAFSLEEMPNAFEWLVVFMHIHNSRRQTSISEC